MNSTDLYKIPRWKVWTGDGSFQQALKAAEKLGYSLNGPIAEAGDFNSLYGYPSGILMINTKVSGPDAKAVFDDDPETEVFLWKNGVLCYFKEPQDLPENWKMRCDGRVMSARTAANSLGYEFISNEQGTFDNYDLCALYGSKESSGRNSLTYLVAEDEWYFTESKDRQKAIEVFLWSDGTINTLPEVIVPPVQTERSPHRLQSRRSWLQARLKEVADAIASAASNDGLVDSALEHEVVYLIQEINKLAKA